MLRQTLQMVRAKNLAEFRSALGMQQFPIMNMLYADRAGNIFYLYNGLIPRRDPQFDWTRPVDGGDPRTAWQGVHTLAELPQVLNPGRGYVQNCNSSPFTTTDSGNPAARGISALHGRGRPTTTNAAPRCRGRLLGAKQEDHVRANSRSAAFDTNVYWAKHELPQLRSSSSRKLRETNAELAGRVEPYLQHLLDWDCRVTAESTAATLCDAWYKELYGIDYPAETCGPLRRQSRTAVQALW